MSAVAFINNVSYACKCFEGSFHRTSHVAMIVAIFRPESDTPSCSRRLRNTWSERNLRRYRLVSCTVERE